MNTLELAGRVPTRADFTKKVFGGFVLLALAITIIFMYHPAKLVMLVLEGMGLFFLLSTAFRWIGEKIAKFILAIMFLIAIGMLFAIAFINVTV